MQNYILKQNEIIINRLLKIKEFIIGNLKFKDDTNNLLSSLERKEKDPLNSFTIVDAGSQTKFSITHTLSTIDSFRKDKQEKPLNNISWADRNNEFINMNQSNESRKTSRLLSGNNQKQIKNSCEVFKSSRNCSFGFYAKSQSGAFKFSKGGISNESTNNYHAFDSSNNKAKNKEEKKCMTKVNRTIINGKTINTIKKHNFPGYCHINYSKKPKDEGINIKIKYHDMLMIDNYNKTFNTMNYYFNTFSSVKKA